MAELRTRKYKYTAQSSRKLISVTGALKLSSFSVSGDMQPITELLSISVKYRTYHDTTYTVGHTVQMIFADGTTPKITSNKVSKLGYQDYFWITNTFASMPPVSAFDPSNVSIQLKADTKPNEVYWYGTSSYALEITVKYYSSEFKPSISSIRAYRANSNGNAADSGTYLTLRAMLKVEKTGTSASGVFELYKVSATDASISGKTPIYKNTGVSGSTSGTAIELKPLSGLTLDIGTSYYFKLVYKYTANASTGVSSTETIESAVICVERVFTNLHLAGVATGGACFGGFSTSTSGNPKLESHFPAYFYGGIANIQAGEIAAIGEVGSGNHKLVTVTFPQKFATGSTPIVVIGFHYDSTAGSGWGNMCVALVDATHTGFTFRYYNNSNNTRNPAFSYIAFGVPV